MESVDRTKIVTEALPTNLNCSLFALVILLLCALIFLYFVFIKDWSIKRNTPILPTDRFDKVDQSLIK